MSSLVAYFGLVLTSTVAVVALGAVVFTRGRRRRVAGLGFALAVMSYGVCWMYALARGDEADRASDEASSPVDDGGSRPGRRVSPGGSTADG